MNLASSYLTNPLQDFFLRKYALEYYRVENKYLCSLEQEAGFFASIPKNM